MRSAADRNYLVPAAPGIVAGWRRVIEAERIDLLLPTTDADVHAAVRHRRALGGRTFLPRPAVVELCADKYRLTQALARRGVRVPRTVPVPSLARVKEAYRRLAATGPVWCRARRGSGSVGALPVRRAEQARAWIAYWSEMRGIPAASFTLSEYLPGRDFACQTLWRDGVLVLARARRVTRLRVDPRETAVAAGGERTHPQLVRARQRGAVELQGRAALVGAGRARNLAEHPERPRLVASLGVAARPRAGGRADPGPRAASRGRPPVPRARPRGAADAPASR